MSLMIDLIGAETREPRGWFEAARGRLGFWRAVAGQRRRLADLPDHILADIGITRAEAEAEARRPFWDARGR